MLFDDLVPSFCMNVYDLYLTFGLYVLDFWGD